MSGSNVFLALTNLYCIYPISIAIDVDDKFMAIVLIFYSLWSAIYHLVESHKHNMVGFNSYIETSIFFLQFDRLSFSLFIATTILRNIKIVLANPIYGLQLMTFGLLSVSLLWISERSSTKAIYLVFHGLWHIFVLIYAGLVIQNI